MRNLGRGLASRPDSTHLRTLVLRNVGLDFSDEHRNRYIRVFIPTALRGVDTETVWTS